MITAVAFVLAAVAATVVRAVAQTAAWDRTRLPAGTLGVNLAGSLLLGLLAGWEAPGVTVAGLAGLGALTTFSTFADEVVGLWELDRPAAVTYVVVSVVAGVGLAWLGLRVVS